MNSQVLTEEVEEILGHGDARQGLKTVYTLKGWYWFGCQGLYKLIDKPTSVYHVPDPFQALECLPALLFFLHGPNLRL